VRFGISTYLALPDRLSTAWLARAAAAGFSHGELFADGKSIDYRDRGQLEELGQWFRDSPLNPLALHSPPRANIAEPDRARRRSNCDEVKRAIEILEYVPCQYVVQHFGDREDLYHGKRVDAAFDSLEELNRFARDRGAEILLENGTSELAAPASLVRFIELTRLGNGVSFDVGHAHLRGGVDDGFGSLEPYLRLIHVHDNDGLSDGHWLPQTGKIDWRAAMRLFRRHPGQVLMASIRDQGEWAQPHIAVHDALSKLMDIEIE
jgi:sugar phosphate isomerase/epimerase